MVASHPSGQAGIQSIAWSTGHLYLELERLACMRGEPAEKYTQGIGQKQMSFCLPDEDVITMACEAGHTIVGGEENASLRASIRLVIFATESGVDQSKAAGMWVHRLLKLPSSCRVVEMKQACYGTTAALRLAASHVQTYPDERALVIGSDEALYSIKTPAEPTQGAGAVAILVSSDPDIASIDPIAGLHSEESNDFWRPNHLKTPIVDGKLSTRCYLNSMKQALLDYQNRCGFSLESFAGFCFHTPFAKMAHKALLQLLRQLPIDRVSSLKEFLQQSLVYCEKVGNCYSASLWIAFSSALDHSCLKEGDRIGLFSYGSGSSGEFLSLRLESGFIQQMEKLLTKQKAFESLCQRALLGEEHYLALHQLKTGEGDFSETRTTTLMAELLEQVGSFSRRFFYKGVEQQQRCYEERQLCD